MVSVELALNNKRNIQSPFLAHAHNAPHKEIQKQSCQLLILVSVDYEGDNQGNRKAGRSLERGRVVCIGFVIWPSFENGSTEHAVLDCQRNNNIYVHRSERKGDILRENGEFPVYTSSQHYIMPANRAHLTVVSYSFDPTTHLPSREREQEVGSIGLKSYSSQKLNCQSRRIAVAMDM